MRQATGELNMTVIIVIAVAGLMAFFSMVVWPTVRGGISNQTNCSDAICDKNTVNHENGTIECHMKDDSKWFSCPYKG